MALSHRAQLNLDLGQKKRLLLTLMDTEQKPKILCLDDESDNLDALERIFRKKFNVLKATSAQAAFELLDTVDWCLRLDHMERPQSVFSLQKALLGEKPPEHRGELRLLGQLKDMFSKWRHKRA